MRATKRPIDVSIKTEQLVTFAKRNGFTERETDVFLLLASKVINSTDLGKKMGVSHHTVSNHLKNIFQKTKVGNKAELLAMFICDVITRQSEQPGASLADPVNVQVVKATEAV